MSSRKPPPDLIRQAIRQALADQGLNQADLARLADDSPVNISRFLSGKRDVTTRVANRWLHALGVELPKPRRKA